VSITILVLGQVEQIKRNEVFIMSKLPRKTGQWKAIQPYKNKIKVRQYPEPNKDITGT